MDPEARRNTFLLKLLIVIFLFAGSIWAGKSVFYLFADFALFGFIATLIYVNVVSFIEKKKLAQLEEPVIYVARHYIEEAVERLVGILSGFIAAISTTTSKQSLIVRSVVKEAHWVAGGCCGSSAFRADCASGLAVSLGLRCQRGGRLRRENRTAKEQSSAENRSAAGTHWLQKDVVIISAA